MTYTKWEHRSRWYKFKFISKWKYRTLLDRIHAFLTRDNHVWDAEFYWNYYLWTMKQLQQAIFAYANKTNDKKLEGFIGRVFLAYMKELNSRIPKTNQKYYNYLSAAHIIESANIYRYHCLSNDERAQDAHMWLDIMYTQAKEMSILGANKNE